MTHDDDLRRLAELINQLNEKMDKTVRAVIAVGEIVRVEGEQQEWRDNKMLEMVQQSQVQQKQHAERMESLARARDELLQTLADELRDLGPVLAHASEQFTLVSKRLSDEILSAKKKPRPALG